MFEAVCEKLEGLGFSPYEAKAYCALLVKSPATGYEVARQAGVPSSKIYEALERLIAKGAATTIEKEDGLLYVPVPVHALAAQLRRHAVMLADALEEDLSEFRSKKDGLFWNLSGDVTIRAMARELVDSAEKQLFVLGWLSELEAIKGELLNAQARGVAIAGLSYGDGPLGIEKIIRRRGRRGGQLRRDRFLLLSVDSKAALAATLGRVSVGCWSTNSSMAYVLSEYLRTQVERASGRLRRVIPHFPKSFRREEHPALVAPGFRFGRRGAKEEKENP